ncbi:MAG: hypothetical protein J5I59_00980 [Saprospiraceae bacterium]|nr:hypothetical protein [Saprospiraceae bacterium]
MHRFRYVVFTLILITIFSYSASAQFGLTLKYVADYEDIPSNVPGRTNDRLRQDGGEIALDYRIKLVDYGVVFGPEVAVKYAAVKGIDIFDGGNLEIGKVDAIKSLGFNFPVTIYVFHFNQCDECPTFKKPNFFKNNFFVQPVIGYEYRSWDTTPADTPLKINDQYVIAGMGIGVDIHLGKYLRLSPIIQYKQGFPMVENPLYNKNLKPSFVEAGVRLGWGR